MNPLLSVTVQAALPATAPAPPVADAQAGTSFSHELARATQSPARDRADADTASAEDGSAQRTREDDEPNGDNDTGPARGARREHKLRQAGRGAGRPVRLPPATAGAALAASARGDAATPELAVAPDTVPRDEDNAQALLDMTALLATATRAAPEVAAQRGTDAPGGDTPPRADPLATTADVSDLQTLAAADALTGGVAAARRDTPATPAEDAGPLSKNAATGADARLIERAAPIDDSALASPARSSRSGVSFPRTAIAADAASMVGAMTAVAAAVSGATPGHGVATFHAELAAAIGSPEFAPALGAQLSTLIRDGVSQARLSLHPAELGPLAVHIRLDGEFAQVDFSAAHALTRQALEDAVPALASALRDSGLTLSGGGVFEQPPERRDARDGARDDASGPRRGSGADMRSAADATALAAAASVPQRSRSRGVVDLYA